MYTIVKYRYIFVYRIKKSDYKIIPIDVFKITTINVHIIERSLYFYVIRLVGGFNNTGT